MNIDLLVKYEMDFLSENEFEKDGMGRFIYESINRRHMVNLPHILADYKDAFLKDFAIGFADWILNESFLPSFNSMGERSYKAAYNESLNKSPEELFELYLKSQQ